MEKSERLISLDVFRGITIAGMILVNNPGSWGKGNIYPALGHADWHGVTPTDLIFPFFLFIVGVAITLSLYKRKERGDDQKKLLLQVFRRAVMIFVIGLVLASFPFFSWGPDGSMKLYDFSKMRIPGVLQRIAVVYFFASLIFIYTKPKTQGIIAGSLLVVYCILMTLVPVPGVGYANLDKTTNLAAWFDRLVMQSHLWSGTQRMWDPEGILSTIPAISTALSGVLLGHWLRTKNEPAVKVTWMFVVGNFAILASMIWDMWFPINKGIWTSSYVLYTSGLALIFFAICYWIVDVKKITWWTKPFVVYGTNAITVFFLSGVLARLMSSIFLVNTGEKYVGLKEYLYSTFYTPNFTPINASLAWALTYVLFWLGMMWILYWKKIFIKV